MARARNSWRRAGNSATYARRPSRRARPVPRPRPQMLYPSRDSPVTAILCTVLTPRAAVDVRVRNLFKPTTVMPGGTSGHDGLRPTVAPSPTLMLPRMVASTQNARGPIFGAGRPVPCPCLLRSPRRIVQRPRCGVFGADARRLVHQQPPDLRRCTSTAPTRKFYSGWPTPRAYPRDPRSSRRSTTRAALAWHGSP